MAHIQGKTPEHLVTLPRALPLPWAVQELVNSRWCNTETGQVFEVEAELPREIFRLDDGGAIQAQGIRIDVLPSSGQVVWACYCLNLLQRRYDQNPSPALLEDIQSALTRAYDHAQRCNYRVFCDSSGAWHCQPQVNFEVGDFVRVVLNDVGLDDDLGRVGQVQAIREDGIAGARIKVLLQGDPLSRFFRCEQLESAHGMVSARLTSLRTEIASLEQEERNLLAEGPLQRGWIESYTKFKNGKEHGPYYILRTPRSEVSRAKSITIPRKDVAEFRSAVKRRRRVDAIHSRLEFLHRECLRMQSIMQNKTSIRKPVEPKTHGEYEIWDTRQGHASYPYKSFSIVAFQWQTGDRNRRIRGPILFRHRLKSTASQAEIDQAIAAAREYIATDRTNSAVREDDSWRKESAALQGENQEPC